MESKQITLKRTANRIAFVSPSGAEVATLRDGSDIIEFDPLADTSEVLGQVNWRAEIEAAGITADVARREISARPEVRMCSSDWFLDIFENREAIVKRAQVLAEERYNGKRLEELPERIQRDLMLDAEVL